jgi:hypothetical protein
MGKNPNTFQKRQREFEKKRKAEDKRKRRQEQKNAPANPTPFIRADGADSDDKSELQTP